MSKQIPWKIGNIIEIYFPFYFDTGGRDLSEFDRLPWYPGFISHTEPGDPLPELFAEAHGTGKARFEIIDIHKPGKYPTRIFYTRKWIDPDGNISGGKTLLIKSIVGFRNALKGLDFYVDIVEHPQLEKRDAS